ncbi:DUF5672 family protein [Polynucleobacter sp. MWH-UH25E]|uniref:DUF5672 family protein n=1 Tax=Polynucleobacter sp. MWH-UH25E TaxID=1855616 RepID=UPI001BFD0575|nr:DUF5672 family protein [Polynucleobacter sp. MWH-UH25E]QWD62295.1 hypothetical protein ICV39_01375 [Polynucleobacter sp. MWH-UH25E]
MLDLTSVTLLCVETRDPALAHWAIERCLRGVRFAKVVLLTDLDRVLERRAGIDYVQAPKIKTTQDYSDLLLTGIDQYVEGSHVLVIQWDSFITNPHLWTDHFLDYDYIGPIWPHHPENPVGNGGFSLRSRKLLQAIKQPGFIKRHPEDYCICVDNKLFLEEQYNIRFASPELADQFAVERAPWHEAFGFHGFFNFAYVLSDSQLSDFLNLLSDSALSGVDAYDLFGALINQKRLKLALELAHRIRFRWKMRRRFLALRLQIMKICLLNKT